MKVNDFFSILTISYLSNVVEVAILAIKLCSIASGSSGNCIYVGTESTQIIVDIGISGKKMEHGLRSIGVDPKSIDALLITHEHSDHIKGVGVLARRYRLPIYATEKTWNKVIEYKTIGKIPEGLYQKIESNQDFKIKDLTIHGFSTYHDAVDPISFRFQKDNKKVSIATDLGYYDEHIINNLKNSNILFLEANHDIDMLKKSRYPYYLKKRILSDVGHLSNDMTGKLLSELYHNNLAHVILGHLSQENNVPELAYASVMEVLAQHEHVKCENLNLLVATRHCHSELVVC